MKPLSDWPPAALLHLHKSLAYGLFFLGAFFGFVTMMPRVMELRGEEPDSMLAAGVIAGLLALALLIIVFIDRISRELERRLDS